MLVACFLPGRAKDLSAPLYDLKYSCRLHGALAIKYIVMSRFFADAKHFHSTVTCCQSAVLICNPNAISGIGSVFKVS